MVKMQSSQCLRRRLWVSWLVPTQREHVIPGYIRVKCVARRPLDKRSASAFGPGVATALSVVQDAVVQDALSTRPDGSRVTANERRSMTSDAPAPNRAHCQVAKVGLSTSLRRQMPSAEH
jgi:hypothetical protein